MDPNIDSGATATLTQPATERAQTEQFSATDLAVSVGCIVVYRLTDLDVRTIASQRRDRNIASTTQPRVGDLCTAAIVRAYGKDQGAAVNLQVFLDGPDTLYVQQRYQGEGDGQWSWH